MKRKLILLIVIDIIFISGLLLTGCGGKKTDDAGITATGGESELIEKSDAVIGSLSGIGTDLSDKTLDDFDVPVADVYIADVNLGSLDLNLDMENTVDIPELSTNLPTNLDTITIDMPSGSGGPVVNDEICSRFASVPDCSYISDPQARALCEECKKQNK